MRTPDSFGPQTQERKPLAILASGESVFDRYKSHIHNNPVIESHLAKALSQINPEGQPFITTSIAFDDLNGTSTCVETTEEDEIVYARRPNRAGYTRFVKGREAEPTNELTLSLLKVPEGYVLITAYLGPKAGPEPWDRNATPDSLAFWNTHALIWGSEEVEPGTETKERPW